jgi:large subunit ribosomal protein L4
METHVLLEKENKKNAIGLIHRLYITQLKNSYKHTASTKTKSEVRGGGRKPRPQKGQGYARSGSIRSPLWVGGGVIFGPKPYLTKKKINKKEKRLAIFLAFFLKKKEYIFLNETSINEFTTVKTKNVVNLLKEFKIDYTQEKVLFILEKINKNLWLAARNLKNVKIITAECLNIKELLHSQHILLPKATLEIINSNYQKNYE